MRKTFRICSDIEPDWAEFILLSYHVVDLLLRYIPASGTVSCCYYSQSTPAPLQGSHAYEEREWKGIIKLRYIMLSLEEAVQELSKMGWEEDNNSVLAWYSIGYTNKHVEALHRGTIKALLNTRFTSNSIILAPGTNLSIFPPGTGPTVLTSEVIICVMYLVI